MKPILFAFIIQLSAFSLGFGAEYFASPTGSAANDGLTPATPWTLARGRTNLAAGVTLTLLPGLYSVDNVVAIYNVAGTAENPAILRSQVKWGAVIANSTNRGVEVWHSSYVIIDGLCVSNCANTGIKIMDSHETVRNCWLTHNGNQQRVNSLDASGPGYGEALIEYNLVENGGSENTNTIKNGHGIYLGGSNSIVRGNVVRHNGGYGIHMYMEDPDLFPRGNQIYNNLTYGHTNFSGVLLYGADGLTGNRPGTNFLFGNTILDGATFSYGGVRMTNNIIYPSVISPLHPIVFSDTHAVQVWADYNLSSTPFTNGYLNAIGAHDVIAATNTLFVSEARRLYWLKPGSVAQGVGLTGDDLGAFQYSAARAGDTRDLSGPGADYWGEPVVTPPTTLNVGFLNITP